MAIDSDNWGFTLLEVLVALALLAIALVAILAADLRNLETLDGARTETAAALLAANKLVEVRAAGADNWSEFAGDAGEPYTDFSYRVEIEPTEMEELARVSVWVEGRGAPRVLLQEVVLRP